MTEAQEADLVRDPVCGMMIEPQDAVSEQEFEGNTYYFCNHSCTQKFAADPKSYLAPAVKPAAPAAQGQQNVAYVCPMDPEVHQMAPGSCPKCGMALEPGDSQRSCHPHRLHLPDASGDCA